MKVRDACVPFDAHSHCGISQRARTLIDDEDDAIVDTDEAAIPTETEPSKVNGVLHST
jgi:hypothetical protein